MTEQRSAGSPLVAPLGHAQVVLGHAQVVLAVSPHLDDAALSVGGTLAHLTGQGADVTVYTVFAGAPSGELSEVAQTMHARYGLEREAIAFAERYREDRAGLGVLGAEAEHGPFLESIYRGRPDGSWRVGRVEDILRLDPDDADLVPAAEADIVRLAQALGADLLLGPTATGGNVDHVLTAQACRKAADRLGIVALEWEDQPYGWNLPPSDVPFTSLPLPPAALARKVRALTYYRTQTRLLWPDTDWRAAVSGQAVERFIQPPISCSSDTELRAL